MPCWDYLCDSCGHQFEFWGPLRAHRKTRKCPSCGKSSERYFPPPVTRKASFTEPEAYRDGKGNFWFGADPPKGYRKVELDSLDKIRKFEREVNTAETAKNKEYMAVRQQAFEESQREARRELRRQLEQGVREVDEPESRRQGRLVYTGRTIPMTEAGRDLARHAVESNNRRDAYRPRESGFTVLPFSYGRDGRDFVRELWKEKKEKIDREKVRVDRR